MAYTGKEHSIIVYTHNMYWYAPIINHTITPSHHHIITPSQEVQPNSPAAQANLIPHTDYILGSEAQIDDDLYTLIENNNHRELKFFVYNSETDSCREVGHVTIM